MPYQVVWKDCNVFSPEGEVTVLHRGDYVPEEVDGLQKSQLATFGAVRFVDLGLPVLDDIPAMMASAPFRTESEPDNADEAPVGFVDTSMGAPSGSPLSGQDPNTSPLTAVSGGDVPASPDAPADPAKADEEPKQEQDAGAKAPGRTATKPEWEDYAVSRGMSRAEADAATKAELINRFG